MRASSVASKGKVSWPIGLRPTLPRRTTKKVGSLVTHFFHNSQWKVVEEREGSATTASRTYDWGIRYRDDLVRRTAKYTPPGGGSPITRTHYALHDYYNVTAIVDTSGVVKERYGYTAFGETRFMNADFTTKAASDYVWDILYKAQARDVETGYYNYGFRYCAPSEAWRLLQGESPCRKSPEGGSPRGQELATRFVPSLAGVKERRNPMNDTTEA